MELFLLRLVKSQLFPHGDGPRTQRRVKPKLIDILWVDDHDQAY
jgi:hypothetical protein